MECCYSSLVLVLGIIALEVANLIDHEIVLLFKLANFCSAKWLDDDGQSDIISYVGRSSK